MDLIKESYERLFEKEYTYDSSLEYNRRLGPFNANITLKQHKIKVNLNLQWKDIDNEIKIGLIQHLLVRLFKSKRRTQNITLYTNFIKNIDILTPVTKTDNVLEASFHRLNAQFFYNLMDRPNLQWGARSFRRLASFNFHNNTITVSTIFKDAPQEMLDYVMYHELLHKHHKFKEGKSRSSYHTKEFREDERKFPGWKQLEDEISKVVRTKRRENVQTQRARKESSKRKGSLWRFFK